jgi:1-phosphatidylinositol-4-phosphate 5-kinase
LSDPQTGEGKSSSIFYRSRDGVLVVKTVSDAEQQCLLRSLQDYSDTMLNRGARGEGSLLPRFFGLYNVKLPSQALCRMLVMNNVFRDNLPWARLEARYDLKGSVLKRFVTDEELVERRLSTLKDLNFCNRHDGTDDSGREIKGR